MDLETLRSFLLWCTIFNGALFAFWCLVCILAPDTVYRTQSRWFPISKETYTVAIYAFLGAFKIVYLVFNVMPLLALWMIA